MCTSHDIVQQSSTYSLQALSNVTLPYSLTINLSSLLPAKTHQVSLDRWIPYEISFNIDQAVFCVNCDDDHNLKNNGLSMLTHPINEYVAKWLPVLKYSLITL